MAQEVTVIGSIYLEKEYMTKYLLSDGTQFLVDELEMLSIRVPREVYVNLIIEM